jgi:FeS assembly SUF system regulator
MSIETEPIWYYFLGGRSMIRMTKQTDYAIVVMTHLASGDESARQNARDLAALTSLPAPMVSKTLKSLARAGLLVSHRGAKGGYSLARSPEDIAVVEIIEAMEGPIAFTQCSDSVADNCAHQTGCPVTGHWQRITRVVWQALAGIRLADMTRTSAAAAKLPLLSALAHTDPATASAGRGEST